jgi:hypothetical protein
VVDRSRTREADARDCVLLCTDDQVISIHIHTEAEEVGRSRFRAEERLYLIPQARRVPDEDVAFPGIDQGTVREVRTDDGPVPVDVEGLTEALLVLEVTRFEGEGEEGLGDGSVAAPTVVKTHLGKRGPEYS